MPAVSMRLQQCPDCAGVTLGNELYWILNAFCFLCFFTLHFALSLSVWPGILYPWNIRWILSEAEKIRDERSHSHFPILNSERSHFDFTNSSEVIFTCATTLLCFHVWLMQCLLGSLRLELRLLQIWRKQSP